MLNIVEKKIILFIHQPVICLINLYQRTLSPDHGLGRFIRPQAGCRFYPSCSEYTKQAINRYGIVKGGWLGLKRLSHCHPLARGGFDPVK